ncbi:MAG: protein-L-isoaspartate O-methyltransferase [Alphaproteobacteria bacterium]|nr:protein-L-isoaspartate O-methyltransferase [Alphaproteobacteria bacterium]
MDFAHARHLMVETQVRTNDVTDARLLSALRRIPREHFVPERLQSLAYAEADLEVAPGRGLLRLRALSKLIAALAPEPGERCLEIAGATGYGAAVLAAITGQAVSLDPDPQLTAAAQSAAERAGIAGFTAVTAPTAGGWPEAAPYDVILLNGAAEILPEAWIAQLAEGGRLGVIVRDGPAGHARIYTKTGAAAAYRVAFDAAPPLAPGLAAPKTFVF